MSTRSFLFLFFLLSKTAEAGILLELLCGLFPGFPVKICDTKAPKTPTSPPNVTTVEFPISLQLWKDFGSDQPLAVRTRPGDTGALYVALRGGDLVRVDKTSLAQTTILQVRASLQYSIWNLDLESGKEKPSHSLLVLMVNAAFSV